MLLHGSAEHEADLTEHLSEVACMARAVGRRMALQAEDLEVLVRAAELHDVGNLAVPDVILQKQGALDASERAIVERHCEAGERILAVAPAMEPVARLVRASHERFDGAGYPDRRAGEEIPLGARIIAVCDAFYAMTNDRPDRSGTGVVDAYSRLRKDAGGQFDPEVVDAFGTVLAAGQAGVPHPEPGAATKRPA